MALFTQPYHDALAQLTMAGAPFEITTVDSPSGPVLAFANHASDLRSFMAGGRDHSDQLLGSWLIKSTDLNFLGVFFIIPIILSSLDRYNFFEEIIFFGFSIFFNKIFNVFFVLFDDESNM